LIFNEIIILPIKKLQADTRFSRFERSYSNISNKTLAVLHKKREHGSTIIVQEEEGSLKGGLAYKMFGNPDDQTENSIKSAQSEEHQRAPSDDATAYFKSKGAGSMRTTA
jgi:hypothetical protein